MRHKNFLHLTIGPYNNRDTCERQLFVKTLYAPGQVPIDFSLAIETQGNQDLAALIASLN